jgi:hypothetical protein
MVACRVGTDLYLDTAAGLVLLNTRLLAGWALGRAAPGTALTARLQALQPQGVDHDVLF